MKSKIIAAIGVGIFAGIGFAAPAFATDEIAADPVVCYETVTHTEFTYDKQKWQIVTPEVPAIPAGPVTPAQPAQGYLEVPGGWVEDSVSVPWSGTIADLIGGLDITVQEGDPIQYVGIHFGTALGTFVYEEDPSYNGTLWSKVAWSGVPVTYYAAQGTIEEYAAEHGAEPITSVTVIYTHPEASHTTVTSITLGGQVLVGTPATPEIPGTPEVPAVPAVFGWVTVESGQGLEVPTSSYYTKRYVETGTVEVSEEVEVPCPVVEPEPEETVTPTPEETGTPIASSASSVEGDLAETGSPFNWAPIVIVIAGILTLGLVFVVISMVRARRAQQ